MIRVLDRYVARFFVTSYLICFSTFVVLFLLIDTVDKLDRFLEASGVVWWRALLRYWLGQIPLIVDRFAPFATLAGAMFAVARLERNNELLPMKAGGISTFRAVAPVLVGATLLGGVSVANNELAIPALADAIRESARFQKSGAIRPGVLRDARGGTLYAEVYDPAARRLYWVTFRDAHGREVRAYHADTASWVPTRGRRGYWLLEGGVIRESAAPARPGAPGAPPEVAQRPIGRGVPADRGAPSTEEGWPLETSIRPIDVESLADRVSLLSFSELRDQVRRQSYLDRLRVQLHARIAAPLAHPILCLLGLPFVLRAGGRRSMFLGLAALLAICASFFVVTFIFHELGNDGLLSPLAAVWTPVVGFALLGIALFDRVPT